MTITQQTSFFDRLDILSNNSAKIELAELFEAYFDCRKNKRNTMNALRFEADYEQNLINLCDEINNGDYRPGQSIAFIIDQPVKREIFAADFRDRIVHHLVIKKLNPLFEKEFIYDSYACRINKGVHFGIKRMDRFIRRCSRNYTQDCFVLKSDIQAFFMSINKNILFERLSHFIEKTYLGLDKPLLRELCRTIIYHEPSKHCILKSKRIKWESLPKDKSLFHTKPYCGLPIGNLTSQILANFYMNYFDHFIKSSLKIPYYGRYVDDFAFVHKDKTYLKWLIPCISEFLLEHLQLKLHPKKMYLQHYTKGVKFLGVIIKPNRIYITNRIKGNFYHTIEKHNTLIKNGKPSKQEKMTFLSSINSYLGIMKHHKTYKLRKKTLLTRLSFWWNNIYHPDSHFNKLTVN